MADVTITIPDAQVERVRTAVTGLMALDQPATAADFRQYVSQLIRDRVLAYEQQVAADTARGAVDEVDIT